MTTLHLAWLCLVGGVTFGLGLVLGAGLGSGTLACCTKKGRAELSKKHQEIVEKAVRQLAERTAGAVEALATQRKQPPPPEADETSSYNPKACCGSNCWAHGLGIGTCWGDVSVIDSNGDDGDGGEAWVHACKGHEDMWLDWGNGGPELYKKETQNASTRKDGTGGSQSEPPSQ